MVFFFLCLPGEYCKGVNDTHFDPFRLADVQFFVNSRRLQSANITLSCFRQATFIALTFNKQNNVVRMESISHG